MFIATVDQRPIPDSEKMSYLKTLLKGKARSAISGMGFSGQFYGAAWSILERKFGRPHVIIDATGESSHSKSGETSRLNRSDQFLSYCFELCDCGQRVRADW